TGGVQGALAQQANTLLAELGEERTQVARKVLLRLTHPGEGTEDTRRRAAMSELETLTDDPESVRELVRAFVDARLLMTGQIDASGEPSVDVAHEALIRGWDRLREWITEDREGLREHRRV